MNGLTMYKNANDKLRFAVNGFTLPVCQYLGLKICGWWLAAAIFVFVHSLTSILAEKLSSKLPIAYRLVQLLRIFRALQTSRVHP